MSHNPKPKNTAYILIRKISVLDSINGTNGTENSMAGRVQALKIGSDIVTPTTQSNGQSQQHRQLITRPLEFSRSLEYPNL